MIVTYFVDRSTPEPINITVENAPVPELSKNTSVDVLDVRTPPKVQNQIREKISSKYHHVGVAIPVEDDVEKLLEESTKKMSFYKLERSSTTPSSGLSTWVLLSNHDIPTTTKKPFVAKNSTEKPVKVFKPVFKQRSTTQKPTPTTSKTTTTTVRVNTFTPSSKSTTTTTTSKPTKLTKVKASLLKGISTSTTTTTEAVTKTTTTEAASALPVEAKDGGQELTVETTQKTKKTQKKKKKNKTRRRKPSKASSKEGDDNKLKEAESPGTQLYSYLRSEIIPVTVGMSLVGLLVTAGLASYYLQPFAALRRSDPVDRKDSGGGYYYQDSSFSNSMPEEEAIGKVIAGMPEDVLQGGGGYKNTRPQNVRYRHVDRRSQIYMNPYGSVEDVKLHDDGEEDEKKFVVGSVPQEVVTPAVVPEHGPRKLGGRFVVGTIPKEFFSTGGASPRGLKVPQRKRRDVPDESENEISHFDSSEVLIKQTTTPEEDVTDATTEMVVKETTPHNVYSPSERPNTLFELLTDLFKLKVKLGLELIQNITSSVSTYVSNVHSRLDQHYRKAQFKHV